MASIDKVNFRSGYYERVGFKDVDCLLHWENLKKEKPLDKKKISEFCLKSSVPGRARNLIWKVLLGIIPEYSEIQQFAEEQRKLHYNDLVQALISLKIICVSTPTCRKLVLARILELGILQEQGDSLVSENQCMLPANNLPHTKLQQMTWIGYESICNALCHMFDLEEECYWIARNLTPMDKGMFEKMGEQSLTILKKESKELYRYKKQKQSMFNESL